MKTKPFQQWFDFLAFSNNEQKNLDLLRNYFFLHFAKSPKMFYQFILLYKKRLEKTGGSAIWNLATKKLFAARYLETLSSLCERFGAFKEKNFLDDLCFRLSEPEKYLEIDSILAAYKKKSQKHIRKIIAVLKDTLVPYRHDVTIKGRYKGHFSAFKKFKKKSRRNRSPAWSVLSLNDIFACRIIVHNNSVRTCFFIANLLHETFFPVVDFFKDYITIPKINGYQSLHTGLNGIIPELDLPVEVQIRTSKMDVFAENGLAAHWIYNQNKELDSMTEKRRKLTEYFTTVAGDTRLPMTHFFSSAGDMFRLGSNSSVLDFAYLIHTRLGERMRYALVNNRKKPLSYVIRDGDRVQLVTGDKPAVEPIWRNYITTRRARKAIIHYLKHYAIPQANS